MSEEKGVHCSMDTLDTYVYQLKINNAISACPSSVCSPGFFYQ